MVLSSLLGLSNFFLHRNHADILQKQSLGNVWLFSDRAILRSTKLLPIRLQCDWAIFQSSTLHFNITCSLHGMHRWKKQSSISHITVTSLQRNYFAYFESVHYICIKMTDSMILDKMQRNTFWTQTNSSEKC